MLTSTWPDTGRRRRGRPSRTRAAGVLLAGAVVGSVLSFVPAPAAAADGPTAVFDYSMPDRFGQDENGDGKIDYFTGTSDDQVLVGGQEKQVDPDTWTVHLDACGSTPGSTYSWTVLDSPDPARPLTVQGGPACDAYTLTVPEEGTYRVLLTASKDGVASAPVLREVVVQDWLIVSIGDSYGSGEGVPDAPIPQDRYVQAEAKWKEAATAWQRVATLEASFAPIQRRIDEFDGHVAELNRTDCTKYLDRCIQLQAWITGDQLQILGEYAKLGIAIVAETVSDVVNAVGATVNALRAHWDATVQVALSFTGALSGFTTWQSRRCHRSANAGSAKAAKQLEDLDPRTSVTFVHLACSGASVVYGLLGLYEGAENLGVENKHCEDSDANREKCIPRQVETAKELIRDREVDAVYTSIGGNDAHFADLVKACIVQEDCYDPNNPRSNVKESLVQECADQAHDPVFMFVFRALCASSFDWVPDFLARSGQELWEEGKNGDKDFPFDPMFLGHKVLYENLAKAVVHPGDGQRDTWLLPKGREDRLFLSEYVDALKDDGGRYCDYDTDGMKTLPFFEGDEAEWVTETVTEELTDNIEEATRVHGWTFVSGIFNGFTNHGYCADDHYIVRLEETFLSQGNYNGMVHPNDKGHGVYGSNILAAWRAKLYTGGDLDAPRRPDQAAFADAGGPYSLPEGSTVPLANDSWDSNGDPLTYAWSHDQGSRVALDSATAAKPTLTAVDDASGTVSVQVSDVHGSRTDRAALTVTNVAPSVAGGPASTVAEGTELSGTATYTDPGKADTHRAVTTFGDAGTTGAQDVTGGSAPWRHTWVDEGRFDVTTEVTDDDGGKAAATRSVTVTNAAPVVGVPTAPVTPVQVGTAITASGSFTDAGRNDKHTATWTWGDGSTSPATLTQEAGGGSVKDTHTFTTPGIYTVELTVADEDGGRATNAFEYVVVYDPAGGFTTGGGWITSPAGAYTPDPTATGTANFGFVSKYQKGASVPTGTTSFRFRAGGLDFDSTSYDWLVIAGSRAQYKGKGTVNGQAGYGFLVSGVDGDAGTTRTADTLRVKIWRTSDGSTVYDNQLGAKDDALATTAIGGGQIQVQAPKR